MYTQHLHNSPGAKFRHVGGYSLIELMVSLAIGLFIIAGLLVVFINSSSSSKTNERTADLLNNGRFAIDIIKEDLRMAGFKGFTYAEPNAATLGNLTPISNECLETGAVAASFVSNIRQGIWGTKDSNPFSGNCIASSHYARGDVLVIRKLSSFSAAPVAGKLYFRSNYVAGEVFKGISTTDCPAPQSLNTAPFNKTPCIPGTAGVDLLDYPIEVHVYFIRPYTNSATENPRVPALCRLVLTDAGGMQEEVVASGIEDMRIQYGRSQTNQTIQFSDADAVTGNSTNTLPSDWDRVNAVRIWLLARNTSPEPGYVNSSVYTMGSSTYPRSGTSTGDAYRRQLFNSVVQLRNMVF